MSRRALHCCVFWIALASCARALAHGLPPDAFAVIAHDAQGPLAVSLSAGVALRRAPQSYQFVCPMLWGDQFAAPVAALADGTIVVGAIKGLMLLGEDGTLRAHPDPAAVGRSSDVVRSALGVFSLRATPQGSELLAIDAQQVRVLWKDASSPYSLTALADKLVLLRANGMLLEQVTVAAADGTELERQTTMLAMPVDNVFARANDGVAYAVVVFRNGSVALGSLQLNAFTMLAQGELSIAGPLTVAGVTLLAVDGKLAQQSGDRVLPLADDHNVVGLAESDGLAYACESEGIAHVNGTALAEPLFRFGWLAAPDLASVIDPDDRFLCNSQWQDLRSDVSLIVPSPSDAATLTAGSGAPLTAAGVGGQLMAAGASGGSAGQFGMSAVLMSPQQVQTQGTSCAMFPGPRSSRAFLLIPTLACLRRRRRRRN